MMMMSRSMFQMKVLVWGRPYCALALDDWIYTEGGILSQATTVCSCERHRNPGQRGCLVQRVADEHAAFQACSLCHCCHQWLC